MKKRITAVFLLGILLLLIVPVLVARITGSERRRFEGVTLEETAYREVDFHNAEQDLDLAGMLFVPEGEGPFPAAVMIHGSGSSHRNNPWYLTLVRHLQEGGIAVLLPDKRGSGKSGGDWRNASFPDLATDSLAAVSFLKEQKEVPISAIGIIGMSQGGHIAPIVASQSTDVDFLVNVVGGTVPMYDLLRYEENHNLREMGVLPGLSHLISVPSSWMIRNVVQREFWEAIGNFDPVPYWRKISIPSLVLYGERDTNVPSEESARIFRSLDNPNITVRIYEGSGHALESPPGEEGNSIFREEARRDILDFVLAATTSRRSSAAGSFLSPWLPGGYECPNHAERSSGSRWS